MAIATTATSARISLGLAFDGEFSIGDQARLGLAGRVVYERELNPSRTVTASSLAAPGFEWQVQAQARSGPEL